MQQQAEHTHRTNHFLTQTDIPTHVHLYTLPCTIAARLRPHIYDVVGCFFLLIRSFPTDDVTCCVCGFQHAPPTQHWRHSRPPILENVRVREFVFLPDVFSPVRVGLSKLAQRACWYPRLSLLTFASTKCLRQWCATRRSPNFTSAARESFWTHWNLCSPMRMKDKWFGKLRTHS